MNETPDRKESAGRAEETAHAAVSERHEPLPASGGGAAAPKESWLDLLRFAFIVAIIVLPIRIFIAQPFIVSGTSMEPSFHDGEYLIVDEISYRFEPPERGEVLIFHSPVENKVLIKRVIGLPGETVTLDGASVIIQNKTHPQGFTLNEAFLANNKDEPRRSYELGPNQYFVLGDNRPVSADSRLWGTLPANDIIGRPVLRLWPLNEIGALPGDESRVIGQ